MFFILITIFVLIFMFTTTVGIHELGHMMVSKWFHVEVPQFSIGIGKKIFSFRFHGTEYCFRLLPLGGYVVVTGQVPLLEKNKKIFVVPNENNEILYIGSKRVLAKKFNNVLSLNVKGYSDLGIYDTNDIFYSFRDDTQRLLGYDSFPVERNKTCLYKRPIGAQLLVFLAGVCMNFLLSIFLFFVVGLTLKHSFLSSLLFGLQINGVVITDTLRLLPSLFTPHGIQQVGGVVYMGNLVYHVVRTGSSFHMNYVYWYQKVEILVLIFGLLNTSVGIMNLLPIPPLDGFHVVRVCIEKITPIPLFVSTVISAIGVFLLILFAVVVNLHDILVIVH